MKPTRTAHREKEGLMYSERKLLIPSEATEQRSLVKWLSYHPLVRDYFLKIDNEGKRTTIEKKGKIIPVGLFNAFKMGLKPGAADLFIFYPTKKYHGLFLEVKRSKKYTPSEMRTDTWIAQQEFLNSVKSVGYAGEVCYGVEDGVSIVEAYLLA